MAIAAGGQLKSLVERLAGVDAALQATRAAQAEVHLQAADQATRQVEGSSAETLHQLVSHSFKLATVLRRLFTQLVEQPVQAWDSRQIRSRGCLNFRTTALLEFAGIRIGDQGAGAKIPVILDLFDPPLHVTFLERCLAVRAARPTLTLKEIAAIVGAERMTDKTCLWCLRSIRL